jgi:plasmid stabilization system protein ParE
MKLVYSPQAVADLGRLRSFIAEKDPASAARIAQEIIARIEHIRAFPGIGRNVKSTPELDSVRDAVFGSYIVRYAATNDAVIVLRIWHHYEDRKNGG